MSYLLTFAAGYAVCKFGFGPTIWGYIKEMVALVRSK